ncbi:MAG TPA: hypothetical protein VH419_04025 [Nocardioidaceae bacterium]|jgi:hypothetical protein
MVVCDYCGTPAPAGVSGEDQEPGTPHDVPFTWVTSVEDGKRRVFCEHCAREHLRSIESKLDSEWW